MWEIRRRAHLELLRRGGEALKQAADRLMTTRHDHPAYPNLIWLAAASRSIGVRDQLVRLAEDPDAAVRFQAVRALHEFFAKDDRASQTFAARLTDANPRVALAATTAFFDSAPVPYESIALVARSHDTYLRQAASLVLAECVLLGFFKAACSVADEPTRLAGVLAVGFRLTLPPAAKPISASLPLAPWQSDDIYRVKYLDAKVDLRNLGRLGMFTVAEHWNGRNTPPTRNCYSPC